MKIKISFLLIFIFFSCDPMDDRLHIINNEKTNIHASISIFDKEKKTEEMGIVKVLKKENKIFGIMSNWNSKLDRDDAKKVLKIIVFYNNFEIIDNHYSQTSSPIIEDSLLNIGEYKYRTYSYKDLEERDWQIKYPDDGFKKGYPIKTSEK